MKHTFAIFGVPQIVISDNGPEYINPKSSICKKIGISNI